MSTPEDTQWPIDHQTKFTESNLHYPTNQPDRPDPTRLHRLIKLLLSKVYSIQRDQIPEELTLKLEYFLSSHEHSRKEFLTYCRVSPEASLLRLLQFKDRANPPPKPHKTWSEKLSEWTESFTEHIARLGDENKPREYYITHLRRVYEELRAAIMAMSIQSQLDVEKTTLNEDALKINREQFRKNLYTYFNINELKNICHDMGINHESLAFTEIESMARELIEWCERHTRLDELRENCRKLRPEVQW